MTHLLKTSLFALTSLITLSMASTSAMAEHHRGFHGEQQSHHGKSMNQGYGCKMLNKGMLNQLNLTPEQKQKIKQIRQEQHKNHQTADVNKETRQAYHQKMHQLISAKDFDTAQAKQLIADKQSYHAQRMLNHLQIQHQIYSLLTGEQKQRLQQGMKHAHHSGK